MHEKDYYSRMFARRTAVCLFVIMLLFLSCILRVAVAATADYREVQARQSSLRLTAGKLRGTIFDCNMVPITNVKSKTIAAVSPTPRAVTAISGVLKDGSRENLLERLKAGKPVLCETERPISSDGVACTTVYQHSSGEMPAVHIIGYTDSDGHGVSGLEKAYDHLLYSEKTVDFVYTTDGKGRILEGVPVKIENDTSVVANGVVTTLDLKIQAIAEKASENMPRGAIIVCEADTAKIRAMVSRPLYDITNVSEYLEMADSPLLNRAISAYNVGSVFKPCVAAAGLESGKGGHSYVCKGGYEIAGRVFGCHNRAGHGLMNLKSAISHSCNTFFYDFSFAVGANAVYKMASSLGFGEKLNLCDGINTAAGSLPAASALLNGGALANLSIGQGQLLLSPTSILTLYCAIAWGGTYRVPSIVEGTLSNGIFTESRKNSPTKVMSEKTAERLREYLAGVINEGTGTSAKPRSCTAAGKTATAQTGRFKNGVEICQGWFCGFFPAESPRYVVVVFCEDTSLLKVSCGQIFASIADEITALMSKQAG